MSVSTMETSKVPNCRRKVVREDMKVYRPPAARTQPFITSTPNGHKASEQQLIQPVQINSDTGKEVRQRQKRPDLERYVPRGRRNLDSPRCGTPLSPAFVNEQRAYSPTNSICSVVSEFSGRNRYFDRSSEQNDARCYKKPPVHGNHPGYLNNAYNKTPQETYRLNERNRNYTPNYRESYQFNERSRNYIHNKQNSQPYKSNGYDNQNVRQHLEFHPIHCKENMHNFDTVPRTKRNKKTRNRRSYSRDHSQESFKGSFTSLNGENCVKNSSSESFDNCSSAHSWKGSNQSVGRSYLSQNHGNNSLDKRKSPAVPNAENICGESTTVIEPAKIESENIQDSFSTEVFEDALQQLPISPIIDSCRTQDVSDVFNSSVEQFGMGFIERDCRTANTSSYSGTEEHIQDSVIEAESTCETLNRMPYSGTESEHIKDSVIEAESGYQTLNSTSYSVTEGEHTKDSTVESSVPVNSRIEHLENEPESSTQDSASYRVQDSIPCLRAPEKRQEEACKEIIPQPYSTISWADDEAWDALYDNNCNCTNESMNMINGKPLRNEIISSVGRVKLETPSNNYQSENVSSSRFMHVVELYDFPAEFTTKDLIVIFKDYIGFHLIWVDDTHALGVFNTPGVAASIVDINHPYVKARPLSEGTAASRAKAELSNDVALLPHKERPVTSAALVRRLVSGALGMKLNVPSEVREEERQKMRKARESKRKIAQLKRDAWDGTLENIAGS